MPVMVGFGLLNFLAICPSLIFFFLHSTHFAKFPMLRFSKCYSPTVLPGFDRTLYADIVTKCSWGSGIYHKNVGLSKFSLFDCKFQNATPLTGVHWFQESFMRTLGTMAVCKLLLFFNSDLPIIKLLIKLCEVFWRTTRWAWKLQQATSAIFIRFQPSLMTNMLVLGNTG